MCEFLACAFFVGKHVFEVSHQLVKLVHEVGLQVRQVVQGGLSVEIVLNLVYLFLQAKFESINARHELIKLILTS